MTLWNQKVAKESEMFLLLLRHEILKRNIFHPYFVWKDKIKMFTRKLDVAWYKWKIT